MSDDVDIRFTRQTRAMGRPTPPPPPPPPPMPPPSAPSSVTSDPGPVPHWLQNLAFATSEPSLFSYSVVRPAHAPYHPYSQSPACAASTGPHSLPSRKRKTSASPSLDPSGSQHHPHVYSPPRTADSEPGRARLRTRSPGADADDDNLVVEHAPWRAASVRPNLHRSASHGHVPSAPAVGGDSRPHSRSASDRPPQGTTGQPAYRQASGVPTAVTDSPYSTEEDGVDAHDSQPSWLRPRAIIYQHPFQLLASGIRTPEGSRHPSAALDTSMSLPPILTLEEVFPLPPPRKVRKSSSSPAVSTRRPPHPQHDAPPRPLMDVSRPIGAPGRPVHPYSNPPLPPPPQPTRGPTYDRSSYTVESHMRTWSPEQRYVSARPPADNHGRPMPLYQGAEYSRQPAYTVAGEVPMPYHDRPPAVEAYYSSSPKFGDGHLVHHHLQHNPEPSSNNPSVPNTAGTFEYSDASHPHPHEVSPSPSMPSTASVSATRTGSPSRPVTAEGAKSAKSDDAAQDSSAPSKRPGKLSAAVTATLKDWLLAHTAHPYPSDEEKRTLCHSTGLSLQQVNNWFINARRRILPSLGHVAISGNRKHVVTVASTSSTSSSRAGSVPGGGGGNRLPASGSSSRLRDEAYHAYPMASAASKAETVVLPNLEPDYEAATYRPHHLPHFPLSGPSQQGRHHPGSSQSRKQP